MTRYVAEEGESCRLVSACALASVCILSLFTHFSLLIREFQPWNILKAGHAYVLETFTSSQPTDTRRALVWRIAGLHTTCIPRASPRASRKLSVVTSTPSASSPIPALLRLSPPSCLSLAPRCSNSTRSSPCTLQAPLRRTHSMTRGHTTRIRRATTSLTRSVYPSWRSTHTTIRSLSVRRRITTGTSGSRLSSPTEVATWAGSSLVGLRIAGPGAPCSSGSGQPEKIYDWSPEKPGRLSGETAGWWRLGTKFLVVKRLEQVGRLWPDKGAIC